MGTASKTCSSKLPWRAQNCRMRALFRRKKTLPLRAASTHNCPATGAGARGWRMCLRSTFWGCRPCTTSPPASATTTLGANASPCCKPPTANRITSTSMPPIRAKTAWAKKPSATPWSLANPVRVKRRSSTSCSRRYKNSTPSPPYSSSTKTEGQKFLCVPVAATTWRWTTASLRASTPCSAKPPKPTSSSCRIWSSCWPTKSHTQRAKKTTFCVPCAPFWTHPCRCAP